MALAEVTIPYAQTLGELREAIPEGAGGGWRSDLNHIANRFDATEARRVIIATALLMDVAKMSIDEAIWTAMVWERG